MENIKICEYGCEKEAHFQLKNKKWCCSKCFMSCEAVRRRNSEALKKAYETGKRKISGFIKPEYQERGRETYKKRAYDLFLENPNTFYTSEVLKRNLLFSGRIEKCELCGISDWNNKKLTLEIDHIDGDRMNNNLSNLRFLCPNCHSQTGTWRGRNINSGKTKISDEELLKALKECKNTRQALMKVGLAPKGANYAKVAKLLDSK